MVLGRQIGIIKWFERGELKMGGMSHLFVSPSHVRRSESHWSGVGRNMASPKVRAKHREMVIGSGK